MSVVNVVSVLSLKTAHVKKDGLGVTVVKVIHMQLPK